MNYIKAICASFVLIAALTLNTGPTNAQMADAAMTEKVLGQHLAAFGAGDIPAIMADYSSDAILVTPGGTLRGHDQIRPLFDGLVAEFSKPGASFEMMQQIVEGDLAYIVWKAETADNVYEVGTDTFIVHDGKIVQQTFASKITPK